MKKGLPSDKPLNVGINIHCSCRWCISEIICNLCLHATRSPDYAIAIWQIPSFQKIPLWSPIILSQEHNYLVKLNCMCAS